LETNEGRADGAPLLATRAWNSAVQTVQLTSGASGEPSFTYSMWRELPRGR
jgi:hypothetical protein